MANTPEQAEFILLSKNIFTALEDRPFAGFVAVGGGRILGVGTGDGSAHRGAGTTILELGEKTVCPGFMDTHCFFTGYALGFAGVDLSGAKTLDEALALAGERAASTPAGKAVLGHGWSGAVDDVAEAELEKRLGGRPAVLFAAGGETCLMNRAARDAYGFTPQTCYPDAYWRIIGEVLGDRDFIVPMFREYMRMLNARGITAVKEMGFDDFYGFADVLETLEKSGGLTLRVHFMSQPVGREMDLPHGRAMRERFRGGFVRFSGYNRMTDGSIGQRCGDLKRPYDDAPDTRCAQDIDYAAIEREVLAADAEGFRFSLHAQGDAAVARVVDIFEKCARDAAGRLVNRQAITDLELSDPADLERMGRLGVAAEIYPQIPSLYTRAEKVAGIAAKVGERGKYYWNRRAMRDNGVAVSCATDLPLLVDDIPESIYCACGGYFADGGEPFNPQNTLSVGELLQAWSRGGAANLQCETELGTLETGKLADIAVLDADVFSLPMDRMREARVCLTFVEGRKVFEAGQ